MPHARCARTGFNSSALRRRIDSKVARCGTLGHGAAAIIEKEAVEPSGGVAAEQQLERPGNLAVAIVVQRGAI